MKFVNLELLAQQRPELGLNNAGLISHLKRTKMGSAPTPQSWLYESVAPDRSLERVIRILDKYKTSFRGIVDDDLIYKGKFGPQGGLEPWEVNRLPLLEQSFAPQKISPIFQTPEWKEAKRIAIERLQFRQNLRPIAPEKVVEHIRKKGGLSTNSGLPSFTRRSKVVTESIKIATNESWKQLPAVIGARSIRQSERNIFMYPFATNINGARFQQVVQDHIRKLQLGEFAAWEGMEHVTKVIQPYMLKKFFKLSGDFTKMDNNFRKQHAEQVFDVVKHAFQKQYWEELHDSIIHTHIIPIVTPSGVAEGEHGVASGSEWTNFLETLFQFILWIYINLKRVNKGVAPIEFVTFLGDDVAAFSTEPITDDFVEASQEVEFIANLEKQFESTVKVHYLRRWFYTDYKVDDICVGVYPLTLNINSQINPERFHDPAVWNGRMFVLRALMICENSYGHPAFNEYAKFVLEGNPKHFSEFAKLSLKQVAREEQKARDIAGFVPSYNQEKMDKSITEYKSYELLREMYS